MKEYKIVVLSPGVQVLAERHLYGELAAVKRQATRTCTSTRVCRSTCTGWMVMKL